MEKLIPGNVYHIYNHANGNENLFREDENYRYFLRKYSEYAFPVVETFAYCLMPNHLHLMVKVKERDEIIRFLQEKRKTPTLQGFETLKELEELSKTISLQFSHLFNSYTQSYNKRFDRRGSLFIPRFKRKIISSENHYVQLIAYIHNNPVHHGFVKEADQWVNSSFHSYLSEKPTKICRTEGLSYFNSKDEFLKLHRKLKKKDVALDFE